MLPIEPTMSVQSDIREHLRIADPELLKEVKESILAAFARENERTKQLDQKAFALLAATGLAASALGALAKLGMIAAFAGLPFGVAAIVALLALRVRHHSAVSDGDVVSAARIEDEERESEQPNALGRYRRRLLAGTWHAYQDTSRMNSGRARQIFFGQLMFAIAVGVFLVLSFFR